MPSHVPATIEKLNAILDGVAHAFFPENLRKSKPVYHGKNIFAIEGVELLNADMDAVFNAFTGKYMT